MQMVYILKKKKKMRSWNCGINFLLFSILAHAYHINSISFNSDAETFLSADDLRINLWNLDISDQSFSKTFFFLKKRNNTETKETTL